METLYFDVLQFLYHFALVVLIGGALLLSSPLAPPSLLARYDGWAILAVILIVVTSALKAGFEITGTLEARLVARWAALAALVVATLFASGWGRPVARSIRAQAAAFDDLPAGSPPRAEFARLHAQARRAMQLALVPGLLALFLS